MSLNTQIALGAFDNVSPGVLTGYIVRDPGSATLTATIEGGAILQQLSGTAASGVNLTLTTQQDTTKAFTASKDTYVYVSSAGALGYLEVANNAAKPSLATLVATGGVGAQFIAKVVTDGTRVTAGGVSDLRQMSGADLRSETLKVGFAAADVGANYWIAPQRCAIVKAQATVITALAGTDAGTITFATGINDVYTNVTTGVITLALSSALGTRAACVPTALNIVQAGQTVRITSAKTTAGGGANCQFLYLPL